MSRELKLFVAYAHEDRETVLHLVHALEQRNWKIYWDEKLAAGQGGWQAMLARELSTSFGVLVVWSKHSVESPAVLAEASAARKNLRLYGISIDGSSIPAEFATEWSVDLGGWDGDPSDSRIDKVLAWPNALKASAVGLGVPIPAPPRATFTKKGPNPSIA